MIFWGMNGRSVKLFYLKKILLLNLFLITLAHWEELVSQAMVANDHTCSAEKKKLT